MERLYETMYRLLENTTSEFHRYIYDRINWDNRMLGLVGPRGVGKIHALLAAYQACQPDRPGTLRLGRQLVLLGPHAL